MSPWVTLIICPNQVIGVKDSRMGEEICACIRVKTGQECTKEEIKAFCKGKVSLTVFGSPPDQYTPLRRPMDLEELGIQPWYSQLGQSQQVPLELFSLPRSPILRSRSTLCLWISTRSPSRAR